MPVKITQWCTLTTAWRWMAVRATMTTTASAAIVGHKWGKQHSVDHMTVMWPHSDCHVTSMWLNKTVYICAVVPWTFKWVARLQPTSHYMVYTLTKIMAPPPSTGLSWQSQTTVTSPAPTQSQSSTAKVGTAHSKWPLTFCASDVARLSHSMAAVR